MGGEAGYEAEYGSREAKASDSTVMVRLRNMNVTRCFLVAIDDIVYSEVTQQIVTAQRATGFWEQNVLCASWYATRHHARCTEQVEYCKGQISGYMGWVGCDKMEASMGLEVWVQTVTHDSSAKRRWGEKDETNHGDACLSHGLSRDLKLGRCYPFLEMYVCTYICMYWL